MLIPSGTVVVHAGSSGAFLGETGAAFRVSSAPIL